MASQIMPPRRFTPQQLAQMAQAPRQPVARAVARPAAPAISLSSRDESIIDQALNMQVPSLPAQEPDQYAAAYEATGRKILTPEERRAAASQSAAAGMAARKARYFESMQYLSLLAQSANIVTEITPPTTGDNIEAIYTPLFTNNTNGAVRLQVFADFVNPGVGVMLSLTRDASDVGKVDELSLTANGKTESISILLMPTFSLWARDRDATFFPMQANDVIRVRIFDPAKLLAYDNLYPKQV